MKRRRRSVERDQHISSFGLALRQYCSAAGLHAAALVDAEGETVDYAGALDPFDIRVAAAEWRIVLERCIEARRLCSATSALALTVRARHRSYHLELLDAGYALIALLPPGAFGVSRRATASVVREICDEAGLCVPARFGVTHERWVCVQVRADASTGRPTAVAAEQVWHPVEILGTFREKGSRDRGFRARLLSGAELMLVRERLGWWYADGPLTGLSGTPRP